MNYNELDHSIKDIPDSGVSAKESSKMDHSKMDPRNMDYTNMAHIMKPGNEMTF